MWVFDLIGSLGLFLLGMWLMTEGLKQAGGKALQSLLGRWTSNRLRGLSAGVLVTALVQSSSAVTVATIGFVNAGLMTFQQSVWVIFGSNVGTTMTGWLVTVFGFSLDIEAVTFPLLGVGAFLRVFSPYKRGQAFGMALAGFGLLFMGIDALQSTFAGFAEQFDMAILATAGMTGVLLGVGIGFLLTLTTQSSSAAIALILTAVASGMAGLTVAAAAIIGANVGTTSTALLATIAATANAKRLAFAHVLFNVITAIVALLLLPVFLRLTALLVTPDAEGNLTLFLALFHTSFNVLGVLLMQPIEPFMSRMLMTMFEKPSALAKSKTILDKNVAAVPDLALRALSLELLDLREQLADVELGKLLSADTRAQTEHQALDSRLDGIDQFIALVSQADLSKELGQLLTASFSVNHYLHNSFESQAGIKERQEEFQAMDPDSRAKLLDWLKEASAFAKNMCHGDAVWRETHKPEMLNAYKQFKNNILTTGVQRLASTESVETALLIASLARRYLEQMLQAMEPLDKFTSPAKTEAVKATKEQQQKAAEQETENASDGKLSNEK